MHDSDVVVDLDDFSKRRRREGQSWFNGRRGVRNFVVLAVLLLTLFAGCVLFFLPTEFQCSLLPEAWCRGSCAAP